MKISRDFQGLALPTGSEEEYLLAVTKEELAVIESSVESVRMIIDYTNRPTGTLTEEAARYIAVMKQMVEKMKEVK